MAAIAHSPSFAKKVGVSQSVGKDFNAADKGKTFNKGGMMKESKAMVGKEMAFMKKKGAPKSMIKHEKAEMKGMNMGGMMKYADGGKMPMKDGKPAFLNGMNMGGMAKYAKGGMAHGGMHKMPSGEMMKNSAMKKGGMPMKDGKPMFMKKMNMGGMSSYAKGGGIESHGKTKGTMVRMATGGSVSSASRRADGIAQRGKTRC